MVVEIAILTIAFLVIFVFRKFPFEIAFLSNLITLILIVFNLTNPFEIFWLSNLKISFVKDSLAYIFSLLVSLASTIIIFYSNGYMKKEKDKARFFSLMCLFSASMLGIIYSSNFLTLLIFWELVGLTSYFLIGFWYERKEVSYAAKKALKTIIFGDLLMIAGIFLFFSELKTFDFFVKPNNFSSLLVISLILISFGAFAKSAQFPLHIWLAEAMEGPTPVSSLLHSATMVKAGIFLIARLLPFFDFLNLLNFLLIIGLVTSIIGALFAMAEYDIKKILAFSTINQLGLMTFALSLNNLTLMLLYSISQTFSKSFLFLFSGLISKHERDIRKVSIKPKSFLFFIGLIGILATAGFPLIGDFFGKDSILEFLFKNNFNLFLITLTISFLSSFYIGRWFFIQVNNYTKRIRIKVEEDFFMKISIFILTILILIQPLIFKFFNLTFHISLETALISLFIVSSSMILSYKFSYLEFPKILQNRLYIDLAYEKFLKIIYFNLFSFFERIDKGFIDKIVNLNYPIFNSLALQIRKIQDGLVNNYIFIVFISFLLIFLLILIL